MIYLNNNIRYGLAMIYSISILLTACSGGPRGNDKSPAEFEISDLSPQIATGFKITENDEMELVEIYNTGDPVHAVQKFYLVKNKEDAAGIDDGEIIQVPVEHMVCLSASHLSFLDALGVIDMLVGVSSIDYVVSPKFLNLVDSGKIKDIGMGDHFKLESLISLNPQIIMVSPQKGQAYEPLKNAGLTVVPNGDFLEQDPLGRAEWIKFVGALTGTGPEALYIFDSIRMAYNQLKILPKNLSDQPTVITGKQYGGFWNLAGGNSYEAQFLEDAGADYLWSDNDDTGGLMLDFETVYNQGLNADYWRFLVYDETPFSYDKLKNEDQRYADFKAFNEKHVIICNTLKTPFFQRGFLEPQIILADYIHIFHPELLPDHQNKYYRLLK